MVANIFRTYGGIYLDSNELAASFNNFSRQLEIYEEISPPDALIRASGYNNVALTQMSIGDYERAKANYERSLEIRNRYPEVAQSLRAITLMNIGVLKQHLGDFEEALDHINRAIVLFDDQLGVGNFKTAESVNTSILYSVAALINSLQEPITI